VKDEYFIDKVKKCEVKDLLNTFHYLKDESKDFKVSPYSYDLYRNSVTDVLHVGGCLGCVIFAGLPVPEIAVGAFGLQRNEQEGLYELSRLCVHPDVQKEEYNITRGSVKGVEGEWRDCSRKHRYMMVFDKDLQKKLTWKEEKWYNNQDDTNSSQ